MSKRNSSRQKRMQRMQTHQSALRTDIASHKLEVKEGEVLPSNSRLSEYDAKHPAGSIKLDDEIAQSALRRIASSDAVAQVTAGGHNWVLNFELSMNMAGLSLLLPLSEFKVVIPVATDVSFDVKRKAQLGEVLAISENKSLLFAIVAMLDILDIRSPRVGRNSCHPAVTQFTGETDILGLFISEGLLVVI